MQLSKAKVSLNVNERYGLLTTVMGAEGLKSRCRLRNDGLIQARRLSCRRALNLRLDDLSNRR